MNDTYMPPFTMVEEIINLVIEIGGPAMIVIDSDTGEYKKLEAPAS